MYTVVLEHMIESTERLVKQMVEFVVGNKYEGGIASECESLIALQ